jgi:16S rRNA (cytosine967-C5)-methyltransferase
VYASPALNRLLSDCADAVAAVRAGRSLTEVLAEVAPTARPGVQALTFHVMRWMGSADAVRARLASKTPPPRVDSLLITAIALLWPEADPPYPDHTLVDQAVTAARERTPAAAAFVNAVLRRFLRERATLVAAAQQDPVSAWNHPAWWVERLRRDWPAQWQDHLRVANSHPPMTLRVNARRQTVGDYVRLLERQGQRAWPLAAPELGGQALQLARPCPVQRLPGFADGWVSVQDAAAQRAAPLLLSGGAGGSPLPPGARVLDACAAPGGKTAHLLEAADLEVTALDSDPQRLARVKETLDRLGLSARLQVADARQTAKWWDGKPFDAILLDAPCSASGIVRRHPDVRWLRRPQDISTLARTQDELLTALWPLLKPGGRLVYATCSVFLAEGRQRIDAFLQRPQAAGARLDPASPGHLPPLIDNPQAAPAASSGVSGDGFYYALLHRPP